MKADAAPEANRWLWLHREDNVAVALSDFKKGDTVRVDDAEIVLADAVDYGHKFAVRPIRGGEPVVKFAETIGLAARDITAGEHVHVHNVRSTRAKR